MKKLFFASPYKIQHKDVCEDNVLELLKSDIRSKLVGVEKFVWKNSDAVLLNNKNIQYIGGFYYETEQGDGEKCIDIVYSELEEVEMCDIFAISLLSYSAIASVSELIYASFLQKPTVVFCDKDITQFKPEYEYWFPILTAIKTNKNIRIVYVKNEEEILDFFANLKD